MSLVASSVAKTGPVPDSIAIRGQMENHKDLGGDGVLSVSDQLCLLAFIKLVISLCGGPRESLSQQGPSVKLEDNGVFKSWPHSALLYLVETDLLGNRFCVSIVAPNGIFQRPCLSNDPTGSVVFS